MINSWGAPTRGWPEFGTKVLDTTIPTQIPVERLWPNRMDKIYLSGPMRGIVDSNFAAFDEARDSIERGYPEFICVSPADLDRNYGIKTIPEMMRRDIKELLDCSAIALLPGWSGSDGVGTELVVARSIGLDIYNYDGGILTKWT